MQTARPITKPTKQRKMMYNAPDHIRHKLLGAHLSAELRATHLVKSFPVRSGDTVRVVRGDHKGFEGKISRIDIRKFRIYLEGLTREKVDGTTIFVAVHPSKILITRLNLDDKWRKRVLERKQKTQTKPKETRKKAKRVEQKIPESVELKAPVEEELEKSLEEQKQAPPEIELKAPATEEPAEEEKVEALKLPKEKAGAKRKRTPKTTKKKAKAEPEQEKKPEPEQKKPRRKSNKKADEGAV